ncbi:MAG: hypothetical protein A2370_00740 [Candidatus Vogelbacteria bacterium RIFOXYB1_FULL_42_16]|uniref:Uncharacterized protein n=2 Tax=Candidatus Vogeliibacteriota TaxID=1817922 RepID=A0A1G2QF48_9BACT|nr:MAG: hypothetical protein A2370_00740 [Candidatus Vogelbacteria bacterium RIFOXYB1_FULL_42_16]OHA59370.1 MAG: hypothetical protein A2607_00220 [Candidatus Vogelbacteria bacterium RIFOXYD1_FULL_42_15]
MKTPDQMVPYLKEKKMDIEKKELHQPVLHILKETAEKFRSLDQEADVALQSKRDTATYKQKLEERAKLLINLPNLLSGKLEDLDSEVKQRIVRDIEWFATSANEALENNNGFALGVLLTHQGSKNTDKNDLEELIALLEK